MYKLILDLPAWMSELEVALIGEALADLSVAQSAMRANNNHQADWSLQWFLEERIDDAQVQIRVSVALSAHDIQLDDFSFRYEQVEQDVNWLEECYRQFPPFSVGPFFIYGSHFQEGVPEGQMGLQIDAATAFGSGEHGTTKGCLQAMLELKAAGHCPWNILDMGTGSGILAIAAWKLWEAPVLAVDNDEEAVRVADKHRDINGVPSGAGQMLSAYGDGFKTDIVKDKKPYELVIANILASALVEMTDELVDVIDEKGFVILSGILNEQAQKVIKVYETAGLELSKTYVVGDWASLVMQKP